MRYFLLNNWQWASTFLVSIIGAFISYKAYKSADMASKDTLQLTISQYNDSLQKRKEDIKNRIIDVAIAEYHRKGQAKSFLLAEYKKLRPKGWVEEEFEEIYKIVGFHTKEKEFKNPLFG